MKKSAFFIILIATFSFSSCYNFSTKVKMDAATKISKLEQKVQNLETQLEKKESELAAQKNLQKQLNALIVKAYNEDDYVNLACYAQTYCSLFPESELCEQYKKYFDSSVTSIINFVSPENKYNFTNETGNWEINNFVDEFGEQTSSKYITTKRLIHGTFTDVYQTNANAALEFIISSDSNIAFSLYENDSTIETFGSKTKPISYDISIKDGLGKNYTLKGTNTSDRVVLTKAYSQTMHNILMKGGFIQIIIKTTRNGSPLTYRFNIQDPTFYNNAIRLLQNQ